MTDEPIDEEIEPHLEDLLEFVDRHDVDVDALLAFIHGVNVGIEVERSGRWDGMTIEEATEWTHEMYLKRIHDDG